LLIGPKIKKKVYAAIRKELSIKDKKVVIADGKNDVCCNYNIKSVLNRE
jgi:hypothetical protein